MSSKYPYRQPLYTVTSDAFELDETIPIEARGLYRILKTCVRKGEQENYFVKPSISWLRLKTGWASNDTVYHYLHVLELIGLVVVDSGKKISNEMNENNNYWIIDDMMLYGPEPLKKLGEGKDLKNRKAVLNLYKDYEKPVAGDITTTSKRKKEIDPEATRLATKLLQFVQRDMPTATGNIQKWASAIELMHTKDGQPYDLIESVMSWAKNDTIPRGNGFCWNNNILSASKLREKFVTLHSQMRAGSSKGYQKVATQDQGTTKTHIKKF